MQKTEQLPSGMQDKNGDWTKEIVLEPMTGEEEDILVDQTRDNGGTLKLNGEERLTAILSRCTVRIGATSRNEATNRYDAPDYFKGEWTKAFTSDRVFAWIRLRQLSLGDKFRFVTNCPACKAPYRACVDLSQQAVTSIALEEASMLEKTFVLPSGKDTIVWRTFSAKDEEPIALIQKKFPDQFLSMIMARRIVSTTSGAKDKLAVMRRMLSSDRQAFGDECDRREGGIDLMVTHACGNDDCRHEWDEKLEVAGRSFFFPSAEKETSSSTPQLSPKPGDGADKMSADYLCGNVSSTSGG